MCCKGRRVGTAHAAAVPDGMHPSVGCTDARSISAGESEEGAELGGEGRIEPGQRGAGARGCFHC